MFFAGHGMASERGNILAPVNAKLDCSTGTVTNGGIVEQIMKATEPARGQMCLACPARLHGRLPPPGAWPNSAATKWPIPSDQAKWG